MSLSATLAGWREPARTNIHGVMMSVVLAVAVGSVVAGIAGAVLAVPLLAMLNAGIRALVSENVNPGGSHRAGGDSGGDSVGAAGSTFPPADVPANAKPPDPLTEESIDRSRTSRRAVHGADGG